VGISIWDGYEISNEIFGFFLISLSNIESRRIFLFPPVQQGNGEQSNNF
jgi:hypothetical protein